VRRQGRMMIYNACFETMNALLGYLTENCCQGRSEQRSPASSKGSKLRARRQKERVS
jgi:hypothetical protein